MERNLRSKQNKRVGQKIHKKGGDWWMYDGYEGQNEEFVKHEYLTRKTLNAKSKMWKMCSVIVKENENLQTKKTNKTRTNQQPQLWPSPSTSAPASITNVNSSHHHRYSFSYYHHRQQQQQLYCHVICQQVNERQTEGHWVMCWEKEKGRERDYMTMRKMEQWFSLVQVNIIVSRSPVYLLLF